MRDECEFGAITYTTVQAAFPIESAAGLLSVVSLVIQTGAVDGIWQTITSDDGSIGTDILKSLSLLSHERY